MPIVLGYGALMCEDHVRRVCGEHLRAFHTGRLVGFRRHWNVLYRNGCYDRGRYVDAATDEPWDGGVAFLGVRPDPSTSFVVSELHLAEPALTIIDGEEYLYRREDVRGIYAPTGANTDEPIWLYRDVPEEFPEGRYAGDVVAIKRSYLERVHRAAHRLQPGEPNAFDATTDSAAWPAVELVWRDA